MLRSPLGRNRGGYCGETIAVHAVLDELDNEASERGWLSERFFVSDGLRLSAYHRASEFPRRRLYISAGIHGDEPAGPLAARVLIEEDQWPEDLEVWLCPCLNPAGFALNTRENSDRVDLNRDYRQFQTPEIRAHRDWLNRCPIFDQALILHEDWEAKGFYLYELNPDNQPSRAEKIIQRVAQVCPIESGNEIDGWQADGGIIRPRINPDDRPQWPEAVYLVVNKSRHGYTLEAPSDYPLPVRVNALVTGVRAAIEEEE